MQKSLRRWYENVTFVIRWKYKIFTQFKDVSDYTKWYIRVKRLLNGGYCNEKQWNKIHSYLVDRMFILDSKRLRNKSGCE